MQVDNGKAVKRMRVAQVAGRISERVILVVESQLYVGNSREAKGASEIQIEFNSILHKSPRGLATRVLGFALEEALARENPSAARDSKSEPRSILV